MTRGGGSGKTPTKVVELLKAAVAKKGQSGVARDSGLTQSAVNRYLAGIGEPSTGTLTKLSKYFDIPVSLLRGDKNLYKTSGGMSTSKPGAEDFEKQMVARRNEAYKKCGSIVQEFFNTIPREDILDAQFVFDDLVDQALIAEIMEDSKCRGLLKK